MTSPPEPGRYPILVVDDEPDNLDAFRFNFKRVFRVLTAASGDEGLAVLQAEDVAVIVADQRMPRMTGLEFLRAARALRPDAVGLILTAYTDSEVLIEAINLGHVYRYVTKPWDAQEMKGVLSQALETFHLRRENARLRRQLEEYAGYLNREMHGAFDFGQIVGEAPALRDVLTRVEQVAPTHSTVLLRGETGTGKELVAHAIHINSPREGRPFVRVNCAALAASLLESELFGHEKGAFTGAIERRAGRFELADGGTLFLDEVGDLPPEVQVKLLRVLQQREFERVGGTQTVKVDVRVISATHRDLEALIAEGRFREDLYYRLNVFPIHLPPLRDRLEDLPRLVEHFVGGFSRTVGKSVRGFDASALAALAGYHWPGNVRELENVVERAIIVARSPEVTAADLDFGRRAAMQHQAPAPGAPPAPRPSAPPPTEAASAPPVLAAPLPAPPRVDGTPATAPAPAPRGDEPAPAPSATFGPASKPLTARLQEQERAEIIQAIEHTGGMIAAAARALGINRSTLYYRMRKHGLDYLLPTHLESGSSDGEPGSS